MHTPHGHGWILACILGGLYGAFVVAHAQAPRVSVPPIPAIAPACTLADTTSATETVHVVVRALAGTLTWDPPACPTCGLYAFSFWTDPKSQVVQTFSYEPITGATIRTLTIKAPAAP